MYDEYMSDDEHEEMIKLIEDFWSIIETEGNNFDYQTEIEMERRALSGAPLYYEMLKCQPTETAKVTAGIAENLSS